MSFESERKSIEARLRDYFDSTIVPVQYENVATLKQGTTTIKDFSKVDKFVRLTITGAGTEQVDIGGNADRHTSIITLGVFTKAGKGTALARKTADELYTIFNRQNFDEICCRTTTMINFDVDADGWYQTNLETEYYTDRQFIIPVKIA